jgi:MFS transporter, DHA1 family, L-arabinose/isopropyl-beta-D-thiogalactopyranoside export protein
MTEAMGKRQWLALAGVAIAAFVFNSSEFMPVGLLTDIGASFGTDEATTGMLVSVYAWAVMILSVPLMIVATRLDFRRLLIVVIAVFLLGQVLTALSNSYWMLMASRLVVACAHSVFWAIAASIAVRLVTSEKRSLALSLVETGTAIAGIIGLPLGRAIGLAVGWRMTFAIVAALSALLLVYLIVTMPWVPGAEPFNVAQLPGLFKNKGLVALFILTALYAWGYYTGYSYIEPFLLQVGGIESGMVTIILSAFGVASICGSLMCSKLYPRFRFPFFRIITIGVPVALLFMHMAVGLGVGAVFADVVLWGICAAAVSVVYQAEIINVSTDEEETVAMAFFSGIFNFGIGFGAFLGGQVVNAAGISNVFYAGGILGVVSIVFCLFIAVRWLKPFPVKK